MPKPLQYNKPSNDFTLKQSTCRATLNAFWGCGVDMHVKKSSPEELFSNQVDGKNYLGLILKLIHAEKNWQFLLVGTVEKTTAFNGGWF